MSVLVNFADFYLRGIHDRSMRSGTELAREIQLTDWSTAGNLFKRSSGVQVRRDIRTRFGCCLDSTKCSWITKLIGPVTGKYQKAAYNNNHSVTFILLLVRPLLN